MTALTLIGCSGSCTAATAINLPWHFEARAATQNVVITSGGSGDPGIAYTNCLGLGVACTYTATSFDLDFDYGTPGAVAAIGDSMVRITGLCPSSGAWGSRYVLNNTPSAFLMAEP